MARLHRDKKTGDYYTEDRLHRVYKGCIGWIVEEYDEQLECWFYSFSTDTLKDAKESL